MQYQQLGQTEARVSRICFGCWQLSPRFWGEVPVEPWRKALDKALECGINFIDTAGAYGDGYAEQCLGDYLQDSGNRDRVVLATKCYWNFQGPERFPDTSHEFILRETENSLRRLKTDRIDLMQIHAWDPLTRPDEVAAAFARLKQDGKIRWVGVSNMNTRQMELYKEEMDVQTFQPQYNLLERDVEEHELPYCLKHRIGVMAYSPLYRGLLSAKYSRDHVFTDHRAHSELYTGKAFQRILDALEALRPFAEKYGLTIAQLAIRWVLTHPAITTAIVGIKTPEMVQSICPAAKGALAREDWHRIAAIMKKAKTEASAHA